MTGSPGTILTKKNEISVTQKELVENQERVLEDTVPLLHFHISKDISSKWVNGVAVNFFTHCSVNF